MKKRLLPILLTLVLVCALPLGVVFVTSPDVTTALVSAAWAEDAVGENSTEGEGSALAQVTFTEVDSETTLKNAVAAGKSVKLTGDIGISSALEVKSSLTLDLNGHVLSRKGAGNFSMIQVKDNAKLTLDDSGSTAVYSFDTDTSDKVWRKVDGTTGDTIKTVNGGVIYGEVNDSGTNEGTISGIEIISGTLEMYGGNIVGVAGKGWYRYGGGVYVSAQCTFNMYGGSIKGCGASRGGGVYNEGTFTMSGSSCIADCIYSGTTGSGGVHSAGTFNLNGGSIEGTLSKQSEDGTGLDIYNEGTLQTTITVSCSVDNRKEIREGRFTGYFYNAGGKIFGGEFQGDVYNSGTINGGEFSTGTVENYGFIHSGTFKGLVVNAGGWIKGGTFYDTVTNRTIIEGGEFRATVNNTCEIRAGKFYGTVNNDVSDDYPGRIGTERSSEYDGGTFYDEVINNGVINRGTFYGTVTGSGTINAEAYETVTFASDGGTAVASQTVLRGQKATKPATPTKAGYIFNDWFAEGAATAFAFTNAPITESMTLTAKWELCGHNASENRPTCTEGVKCSVCAADLPATGHSGGKATCAAKAKCSVCQAEYGDLEPNNHADLTHVLAAAATTKAEGNIEYWHCTGCGRYFSDAQAAEEITQADTVLAKLPPRYYYNSGTAAKPDSGKKNSPGTADPGVMLYGAAALLSLTGMAVLTGKKK